MKKREKKKTKRRRPEILEIWKEFEIGETKKKHVSIW